jgi:hypothetical protein
MQTSDELQLAFKEMHVPIKSTLTAKDVLELLSKMATLKVLLLEHINKDSYVK